MSIELNPIYKPIFTTDKRYIVITGGRGSSKSFSESTASVLISYEPNHVWLRTRYSMLTADDSIIPEYTEKIDLLERNLDFTITKTDIRNNLSGSRVIFRGIKTASGDQTAKLKSINGLSDWTLEEAEELTDEKKFDDIDFSVRSSKCKNRIILILNPTNKEHWIWKRWFENHLTYKEIDGFQIPISAHPEICHIHTTYLDNKHLPKEFVENISRLKVTNPSKYYHTVLGGWLEKEEGVVFENWEEGEFNKYFPSVYALDFGYHPDPLAMLRIAVDKREKITWGQEKLYKTKLSTDQVVREVRSCIERKNDLILCDTSEKRLYAELKAAGLNVQMVSKKMRGQDGSIVTDIRDMMDYRKIVDPYSYNLKKELNSYVWNDKKASIPVDDNNHLIDDWRYGFRKIVGWPKTGGVKQINQRNF